MKRIFALMLACIMLVCSVNALAEAFDLSGMTDEELNDLISEAIAERDNRQQSHEPVTINASTDKYTWYVQDYVGRNAASFGYTSLGGDRLERYGNGYLTFTFVTEDGTYLDIDDEEQLRQYVVTGQNIAPNTQIRYIFEKDSEGNEYSSLLEWQSVECVDLTVRRLDGTLRGEPIDFELIPIDVSPDRYTEHIRNYVGKNLASFGYASLGGDRRDHYGETTVKLNMVTQDGTYIDPEDTQQLMRYVVTRQDVAPNSEMKITYLKDSHGEEYSSLVDSQTYETVTLYVREIGD